MRHLLDLMLVDRNLIVDLIALDFERETDIDTLLCIIVTLAAFRREEQAENL
jgi:hypothetical protein